MTPSIPATLCDPFEGARLLCTAPITGIFGALVPANARLIAGEIGSTERRRFLTVTGRSPLGVAVEVNVWADDWDKLILLLDSPLAMCHAKTWLATRLGAANPFDVSFWRLHDQHGRWSDRLRPYDLAADGKHVALFVDGSVSIVDFKRGFSIPGLADMSYAEALAAACVAVGGAS